MTLQIPVQIPFSQKNTIIFDFDGTLIDTLDQFVDAYNHIAPSLGCKTVTREEQKVLRDSRPQEFFHTYNIALWKLPFLIQRIRKYLRTLLYDLELSQEVSSFIAQLYEEGYTLGILSSNTEKTIRHILAKHDLERCFRFIHTGPNLFGKDKAMRKILKKNKLQTENVVYIGDETRDVEAMHRIGVPIVAVTWGYSSAEALEKLHPTYISHTFSEFKELFSL